MAELPIVPERDADMPLNLGEGDEPQPMQGVQGQAALDAALAERQREEWKAYYEAIQEELQLDDEEVAAKLVAAAASQQARDRLIVDEIQRVRNAQFKAFTASLEQVALRPFVEEFQEAMRTLDQNTGYRRFVPADQVEPTRQFVLGAILGVAGDGLVGNPTCLYDAITLLAGVDSEGDRKNYMAFRTKTAVVRDAAHKLLGARLPGGPCGPMDEMLIAYTHRRLRGALPNTERWYTLADAHMTIFLGHPFARCDENDGSKYVDDTKAAAQFKKRWERGSNATKDMSLPAHEVFGDLNGQAACGVFLELAEELLLRSDRTKDIFRTFQERAPRVAEYAQGILATDGNKNQRLLMERPRTCPTDNQKRRLTGRHLTEVDNGEIAARVCAYFYRIVNTDEAKWSYAPVGVPMPLTYGVGNVKEEARIYVETVFELLATTSIFLHAPLSIMCFTALCRASNDPKYYKRTGLLKRTLGILDPIRDVHELVQSFRHHVIRCASGAAADFNLRLLYQYYEYKKPGSARVEVFPEPNAFLNKTQKGLINARLLNRTWDWVKKNPIKTVLGSVQLVGPLFMYRMGPGFFVKLLGKAIARGAGQQATRRADNLQIALQSTRILTRTRAAVKSVVSPPTVLQKDAAATFSMLNGAITWDKTVNSAAAMTESGSKALFSTEAATIVLQASTMYAVGPILGTLIEQQLKSGSASREWLERQRRAAARDLFNYYEQEGGWLKAKPSKPCIGETAEEAAVVHVEGTVELLPGADTGGCAEGYPVDPCLLVNKVNNGDFNESALSIATGAMVMNSLEFQDLVFAAAASDSNADATLSDEMLLLFLGVALMAQEDVVLPPGQMTMAALDRSDVDAQARALDEIAPLGMKKLLLYPEKQLSPRDLYAPAGTEPPPARAPLTVAPVSPDGYETDDVPTPMVPTKPPKFEKLKDDGKRLRTGAPAGETKVSELTARLASVLDIVAPLPKGAR